MIARGKGASGEDYGCERGERARNWADRGARDCADRGDCADWRARAGTRDCAD